MFFIRSRVKMKRNDTTALLSNSLDRENFTEVSVAQTAGEMQPRVFTDGLIAGDLTSNTVSDILRTVTDDLLAEGATVATNSPTLSDVITQVGNTSILDVMPQLVNTSRNISTALPSALNVTSRIPTVSMTTTEVITTSQWLSEQETTSLPLETTTTTEQLVKEIDRIVQDILLTTRSPVSSTGANDGLESVTGPDDIITETGIPISLLWVPYVILSCLLVLLMVVSFVRFHRKKGHKYRRRRAAFWRQLNKQHLINHVATTSSPPNGGAAIPKEYLSNSGQNNAQAKPSTSKGGRKSRRPIVYNSNMNGSMVDVRCGLSESLGTFRGKPKPPHPSSIWLLPPRQGADVVPQAGSERGPSRREDDHTFLLQQTRL